MSTFEKACYGTYVMGADLSDSLYEAVALNSAGRVVKSTDTTDVVIGVVAENIKNGAAGQTVSIALINGSDKLLVKVNGAVTVGQLVAPSADDGKAEARADLAAIPTGAMAFGIALQAATADNDVIQFKAMSLAGSA